jgi:hypothetical protein
MVARFCRAFKMNGTAFTVITPEGIQHRTLSLLDRVYCSWRMARA